MTEKTDHSDMYIYNHTISSIFIIIIIIYTSTVEFWIMIGQKAFINFPQQFSLKRNKNASPVHDNIKYVTNTREILGYIMIVNKLRSVICFLMAWCFYYLFWNPPLVIFVLVTP